MGSMFEHLEVYRRAVAMRSETHWRRLEIRDQTAVESRLDLSDVLIRDLLSNLYFLLLWGARERAPRWRLFSGSPSWTHFELCAWSRTG